MINYFDTRSFTAAFNQILRRFSEAPEVHSGHWQGMDISSQPAGRMVELHNVVLHVPQVPRSLENLQRDLAGRVNLPWADDHFKERVSRAPINPGVEWANWPDGASADRFRDRNGQFNHNYMERYWPKYAGLVKAATGTPEDFWAGLNELPPMSTLRGIRHPYGDLGDVVRVLAADPLTRQAYLPIYFPEDNSEGTGGRKPCTLGYQFILRDGKLHIYYPMRSCDFYRHWGDDVYMTVLLGWWVLKELVSLDPETWKGVELGSLVMHCTSLHMFVNDYFKLRSNVGG